MVRLVFDTNIWLDWLVFDDPSVAALKAAVAAKRAEVYIDAGCEAELARVLGYPLGAHSLDVPGQAACLAECRRVAHWVDGRLPRGARAQLPLCSDPDDQKFLEAALAARAELLVTKDRALLDLARRARRKLTPFRILPPEAAAAVIGPSPAA